MNLRVGRSIGVFPWARSMKEPWQNPKCTFGPSPTYRGRPSAMICRNMKRTLEPAYVQPTLTADPINDL
jgi:hypothetical protein